MARIELTDELASALRVVPRRVDYWMAVMCRLAKDNFSRCLAFFFGPLFVGFGSLFAFVFIPNCGLLDSLRFRSPLDNTVGVVDTVIATNDKPQTFRVEYHFQDHLNRRIDSAGYVQCNVPVVGEKRPVEFVRNRQTINRMRGIDSNRLPQFLAVIAFFFPFTGAILMLIAVRATLTGPNIPEIVENGIPIQAMVEIVRQARFGSRNRAARRVTYVYADANGTKFTGTYVECDDVPKVGEHLLILAHSERFDESIALASQPFMEFAPNGTAYTKGAAVAVFFFFGSVIVGAALWIATITRLVLSLYS